MGNTENNSGGFRPDVHRNEEILLEIPKSRLRRTVDNFLSLDFARDGELVESQIFL